MISESAIFWLCFVSFISGIAIAGVYYERKILEWRLRWIDVEHDHANALGVKPRIITETFPKG